MLKLTPNLTMAFGCVERVSLSKTQGTPDLSARIQAGNGAVSASDGVWRFLTAFRVRALARVRLPGCLRKRECPQAQTNTTETVLVPGFPPNGSKRGCSARGRGGVQPDCLVIGVRRQKTSAYGHEVGRRIVDGWVGK